jgi:pantetheine-phosphate adenylyltransferase
MKTGAMYPGTFDPITNGHCDLLRRAARIFDRLVVAIAANPGKEPLFDLDERVDLARQVLAGDNKIEVVGYTGLTVAFAREHGLGVMIRGLRAVSDFEFEFQLATMSRQIAEEIESVFLTPDAQFSFISSGMVREIALLGGDVSQFVPPVVEEALKHKAAMHRQ